MAELSPRRRQVLEGVGLSLALLAAFLLLFYAVLDTWADWGPKGPRGGWTSLPVYLMAFCGLSQWLYVAPCFLFLRRRFPAVAEGLVLGAAAILVLDLAAFFLWSR